MLKTLLWTGFLIIVLIYTVPIDAGRNNWEDPPPNDPVVLAALRDFYRALGGPFWKRQACWDSNSDGCSHYCLDWYGITCENGLITTIDLCRNNLNGTLPTSLPDISSLRTLRLSNNNIGGNIPSCIGSLTNLTTLEIANNSLVGSIPDSIKWTRLQSLDLSRNQLISPIPDSLYTLPLLHLDLGLNQFSGALSPQIGQLSRLTYLDMSRNALSGTIPVTLAKLQYLENLILHNNQLTGALHHETFASLKSLRKLLLNGNSLNGSMHAISELDSLRVVSLSGNKLTGEIIPSIGRLTSLSTLDLSDNLLVGSLPMESIRELFVDGSLTFVNVYGNPLMKSPTATPPSWLFEDPGVVDLEGTFKCNTLVATDRSTMIVRVDPAYFQYWNCYCATGFYGTPPLSCMICPEDALCVGSVITFPSGLYPVWDFNSKFNASALRLQQCPQDAMSQMSGQSVCNPQGNVTISYSNPNRGYKFNEDDLCASGRTGFMCTRCDCDLNDTESDGSPNSCFYRRGNACAQCFDTFSPHQSLIFAIVFPISICAVLAAGFMVSQGSCTCCSSTKQLPQASYVDKRKSMTSFSDRASSGSQQSDPVVQRPTIGGHVKILIMWIQTLAKIISWPQVWAVSTLAAVLDVFNFQLLPLGFFCALPSLTLEIWNVTFYMLSPVAVIMIVVVALSIAKIGQLINDRTSKTVIEEDYVNDELLAIPGTAPKTQQWQPSLWHRIARWILVVLYFVYFGVSVEALSLVNCSLRGGVGVRYLESRPFIACGSLEWFPLRTVAMVTIPAYTIGVFILFSLIFIALRTRISAVVTQGAAVDPALKHILGFLFESYKPEMWWYEMLIFCRRLLLAIVIGIVPASSVFKAFCSFVVMLISLLLQNWIQPFRTTIENRTEELGLVMLIGTFGAQFFATTSTGTPVEHTDILFLMLLCFDGIFLVFMLVGLFRAVFSRTQCSRRSSKNRQREYRRTRPSHPHM